jgi:mannose-6-phosphate isomerase-like protein (cupin superfamily)
MTTSFRRIVTGHDEEGRATITSDAPPTAEFAIQSVPGLVFQEVWRTHDSPAVIDNGADPTLVPLQLLPSPRGSVIRVLDIPPGGVHETDASAAASSFAEMGASHTVTSRGKSSHPFMHRTETVDYGILLAGEIWLVVDTGEVKLNPGDIVIQRGTSHAWSNRSARPARLIFILLGGKFAAGIE